MYVFFIVQIFTHKLQTHNTCVFLKAATKEVVLAMWSAFHQTQVSLCGRLSCSAPNQQSHSMYLVVTLGPIKLHEGVAASKN